MFMCACIQYVCVYFCDQASKKNHISINTTQTGLSVQSSFFPRILPFSHLNLKAVCGRGRTHSLPAADTSY